MCDSQFSQSVMSSSLWPQGLHHARIPCASPTLGACSNSYPSSWWCYPPSQPLLSPSFPTFNLSSIRVFSNESVLHIRWPKYCSFSISPSNDYLGLISFRMDWLDLWFSPRDCQESSPTPQFKSINSSVVSFLYSSTFTSIHDYCKNNSFD